METASDFTNSKQDFLCNEIKTVIIGANPQNNRPRIAELNLDRSRKMKNHENYEFLRTEEKTSPTFQLQVHCFGKTMQEQC